ncbi:dirigent protein 18 [Arabidopsis lyrata subsp. lyrata]|nr:dirigent protein 18 [Arabidopsis lyrata subsp. lyrata]|eukprot:XP_002870373.2 dirigent protein 18 [Arabidopsis lyrata subsp. lyrata]
MQQLHKSFSSVFIHQLINLKSFKSCLLNKTKNHPKQISSNMMKQSPSSLSTSIFLIVALFTATTALDPAPEDPIFELYMHDILGGSSPTARPITGLLGNIYNGQVPFAKQIGFVPPQNGVAIPNANGALPTVNGINGIPLGTGLSGTAFSGQNLNGIQTQLGPDGLSLGFGTITVIDDIITSGPDLGSQPLGKAQGVYVASSADGSTQMMAFTAMLEGGEYNDNLNFYGIYRIGSAMSHLSVTGGTGRFKNACGFAEVRPLIPAGQHFVDGAEMLLRIIVHLKY